MVNKMIQIFPKPQEIIFFKNSYESVFYDSIDLGPFDNEIINQEIKKIKTIKDRKKDAKIKYRKANLDEEEFKIDVKIDNIIIQCSTFKSAYYATLVLQDILKDKRTYELSLHDYPNVKIRGIMIDISRNKVPKLETLKKMIYDFSLMRINHVELYVEGFSFEMKSFEEIHLDENYLTIQELKELEKYCQDYFIDLVPNANGFGHMAEFLKLDQYKHLGECEDEIDLWGFKRDPATLDFRNPESLELVKRIYQDIIPLYKSKYFNMDCDEPMELGWGKNKEYVNEVGEANCYLEYVNKLVDVVKSYHKIPMIWGDVLVRHKEVLGKLPKDLIFIDWGYGHTYDFDTHAKALSEQNVQFMTAPGTNTWATILGKDIDMKGSTDHAVDACIKYKGLGVLNTDWGDFGHLQYLPSSYPGFIYCSYKSWSKLEYDELDIAMTKFFEPTLGKLIIELSSYSSLDTYRSYGNTLFMPVMIMAFSNHYADLEKIFLEKMQINLLSDETYKKYVVFFLTMIERLNKLSQTTETMELLNNTKLLLTLAKLNKELKKYFSNLDYDFSNVVSEIQAYLVTHQKLWELRNKPNGYKLSKRNLELLVQVLLKMNGKDKK